jgi:sulfopyruvate decarboxylase TPP-binding subunit
MRVVEIPGHFSDESRNISSESLKKCLEEIGIEYIVTVPESSYEVLLKDIVNSSSIKLISVCRESEGMSICSGLTYGGKKVMMLCCYKGIYNSIDSLLGTAIRTQSSFLLMVSDPSPAKVKRMAGDLEEGIFTSELLKTIKIPVYEVSEESEIPNIKTAWEQTKDSIKPVAVLIR